MKTGADLIAKERQRQIEKEGYTAEHDDKEAGDLAVAGACYALDTASRISHQHESWHYHYERESRDMFPWDEEYWKPTINDPIRELTKAGALIAAEIDRLQRLTK